MLYLIATPIGNMKDISFRAIEALKEVDIIACEDTRTMKKILTHYEIQGKLVSFHEHNEEKAGKKIISLLKEGKTVALTSDRGTPSISDPGYTLVDKAIKENLDFTMIPGPSAFIMALALSGLPVHSFTFRGFPPHKGGKRKSFLKADILSPYTLIYYESPYRLIKFLNDAIEIFGDRKGAVAKDLTKKFEKIERGKLSEILENMEGTKIKGEYVVLIEGYKEK